MERIMYMESIRGYPYKPQYQLAEELGISKGTVQNRLKEIRGEIKSGRYVKQAIIEDGNIVLINVLVFLDYMSCRQQLRSKNLRKHVPPFRPEEWTRLLGWNEKIVRMGG